MQSKTDKSYTLNDNPHEVETPETEQLKTLFKSVKTIAIVGISNKLHRDSYNVGHYLQQAGYKIIPVNPAYDTILNEKSYPNLKSIPETVDLVDVFRKPEHVPGVVNEALTISPKAIWLQLGTGDHPELSKKAEKEGIKFIQNQCIKVVHQSLAL